VSFIVCIVVISCRYEKVGRVDDSPLSCLWRCMTGQPTAGAGLGRAVTNHLLDLDLDLNIKYRCPSSHPPFTPFPLPPHGTMASIFSSRLTSAYTALRGDLGHPQSPTETIDKLVDRIQTSPNVDDRRTAVLGLKGCIREYRELVGERALASLVAVLQYDAPNDPEIAKAVLETLMGLMEVGEKPARDDIALRLMDEFFAVSSLPNQLYFR
jgi:hypothetical protein